MRANSGQGGGLASIVKSLQQFTLHQFTTVLQRTRSQERSPRIRRALSRARTYERIHVSMMHQVCDVQLNILGHDRATNQTNKQIRE
jgi:hypothetical protein